MYTVPIDAFPFGLYLWDGVISSHLRKEFNSYRRFPDRPL